MVAILSKSVAIIELLTLRQVIGWLYDQGKYKDIVQITRKILSTVCVSGDDEYYDDIYLKCLMKLMEGGTLKYCGVGWNFPRVYFRTPSRFFFRRVQIRRHSMLDPHK